MGIDGSGGNWRNHYGCESSDDRHLRVGWEDKGMPDIGTMTTTWPPGPVVWVESQEPLALFVISLKNDTELLVIAHSTDEAWRIASARAAQQIMRQTIPILPENIVWIPLPTQPQLLHVFEGGKEK